MKREGEKEREQEINRVRDSIGQKWKWSGLEMAVSEKGHLSIFSKTNQ